jgi:acyl dehydratase
MQAQDTRPLGARVTMDMVGATTPGHPVAWTAKDAALYALGVGASMDDAFADLQYTTENSEGVTPKTVPSMLTVLALGQLPRPLSHLDMARFLHAEQKIELFRPLPTAGEGTVSSEVLSALDKGTDAFVQSALTLRDSHGSAMARSTNMLFVRGAGGFGGPRGGTTPRPFPDRAPDRQVTYRTRRDQALLYRLNGDRNPLHSDPIHARERGFERPILHGLATYGFACRALVEGAASSDPHRLKMMECRFSKPVYPGTALTTEIWTVGEGQILFRMVDESGDLVLDRGAATIAD